VFSPLRGVHYVVYDQVIQLLYTHGFCDRDVTPYYMALQWLSSLV